MSEHIITILDRPRSGPGIGRKTLVEPSKRAGQLGRRRLQRQEDFFPFIADWNGSQKTASGDLSVDVIVDALPGDIVLLKVTSENPVTATPEWTEKVALSSGSVCLTVFWKRSTVPGIDDTPAIVSGSGFKLATTVSYRGCIETGDPFNVTSSATGSGAAITIPGATTTTDRCLISMVYCSSRDFDGQDNFSDIANPDLTRVVEWIDDQYTALGSGGVMGTSKGELQNAGAYGDTTLIAVTSDDWCAMTLALIPEAMPKPHWVNFYINAIGTVVVGNDPGYLRIGDVIVFAVERDVPAVITGFTEAGSSPQVGGSTVLSVFWKRVTGDTTIAFTGTDPTDHTVVFGTAFRNCVSTGSPFDATNGGTGSGADLTIPGGSTTKDNCALFAIVSSTRSAFGMSAVGWTNPDTDAFFIMEDKGTMVGNGGCLAAAIARLGSAGAFGDTTLTQADAVDWAGWQGALKAT